MASFAAPLWLAALAALAVPIVIHLRSHRPGRMVRLGSVRHLAATPTPHARGWRLRDRLLLALRAAAIALLVLALARPLLLHRTERPRLVLVAAELAGPDAPERAQTLLDSLERSGASIRLLRAGLTPSIQADTAIPADRDANYWSLIAEADRALRPASIVVVAPTDARHFRGLRPAVASDTRWVTLRPAAAAAIARPRPAATVAIYADSDHAGDARYAAAAFEAVRAADGDTTRAALPVRAAAAPVSDSAAEWTVWLASEPPPDPLQRRARQGGVLLTEAALGGAAVPVWRSAAGAPLLSVAPLGSGLHFAFATRLDPRAMPMLLSPAFADSMLALWRRSGAGISAAEAPLAPRQALPARGDRAAAASAAAAASSWPASVLWLLAVAALCAERALAARRPTAGRLP